MLSVVVAMQPEADPLVALWQLKKVEPDNPSLEDKAAG